MASVPLRVSRSRGMSQARLNNNDPVQPIDMDTDARGALWGWKIQALEQKLCQLRGYSVGQRRAEPPLCQTLGKVKHGTYA